MRKHGSPKIITTDKLASYRAALREIGFAERQLCGARTNNRSEKSHLPFRRRERAMQKFKNCATLQSLISLHSQIYNHFNHERHLETRQAYKQKRCAALSEWFQLCAS
jgi:putative transposase